MAHAVMMRRDVTVWWWVQSPTTKEEDTGVPICTNGYVCVYLCLTPGSENVDEENLSCLSIQANKVEGTRLIAGIDGGQYLL